MLNQGDEFDPPRDPAIAAALRETLLEGMEESERRVAAAIAFALRARQTREPWWQWTAGWGRTLIPLGIAASALLALLLSREIPLGARTDAPRKPSERALAAAVATAQPAHAISRAFVGSVDPDSLFIATVLR